jgi:CRP/FNR family cyclic AMP-dependent transcriptional regulator
LADSPAQRDAAVLPAALETAFARQATSLRAAARRMLVSPEFRSTSVYRVIRGRVQVTLLSAAGRQVILRDLTAGDLFGELAAIDEQPRSTSIFAIEECTLAVLPGPVFRKVAFGEPAAAEWLARRLAAQIRDLTGRVFELNALPVAARLHCEILRLCAALGEDAGALSIEPAPTHAEFASRIGSHREAVTRELGYLSRRKIISMGRRRLTVTDLAGLVNLVRTGAGHPSFDPEAT